MSSSGVPEDLRELAAVAARAFLDHEGSLDPVGQGQSLTYRVAAQDGEYLLRLHWALFPLEDPAFFDPRVIESECAWLRALSNETELVVQEPVRSPRGSYVLPLARPDGGDEVPCTVLRWVAGEHLDGKRTDAQARQLGELLATLHAHARRWERPSSFVRPTLDTASWRKALTRVDELVSLGLASRAERELLTRAIDQVDAELTPHARDPEHIGLIHADLHGANYVFHQGSPRPIDFGRSSFGPWLYDLAECAAHLGPRRRRGLLEAYATHHALADGDLRRIEGYFVASLVEVFGNNAADPSEHDYLARAVPAWTPHIRRYVDGAPFLFEL